jgi:hypothetical protein
LETGVFGFSLNEKKATLLETSIKNVSRVVDSAVKKLQSSFPPINTYIMKP